MIDRTFPLWQRYNLRRGVVKYSRCVNLTVGKVISGLQGTIRIRRAYNRKLNWQGFRKKDCNFS